MNMREIIDQNEEYIVKMRRHFHMYPELSMEEYETTKFIAEHLEEMGIDYTIPEEGVGVLGHIKGAKPGKVVALRADIDALNVTEENDVPYKSKTKGKMHACGHDAHTAMLLGAAKALSSIKDQLNGEVYLVFQPGEEVAQGAKCMIRHGDWFEKIDSIYGAHIWSELEAGKVSVEAGPRMAAADGWKLEVEGISGHGSSPEGTIDATVVASAIVMNLQYLVSRQYNADKAISFSVGSLHSGNRFNIISGRAKLEGTTRYFSRDIRDTVEENFERIVENTAAAFGAKTHIDYIYLLPATINDQDQSDIATEAAKKIGAEVIKMDKTLGSEDFSYFGEGIPGETEGKPAVYAFIGGGNPDKDANYALHHEKFNIDEDALTVGAALYAQYAVDAMNK